MTVLYVVKSKFKEVLASVLPITVLVIILNFTLTPMEGPMMGRFLLGAALILIGLTIFLIGVDIGVTPLGNNTGAALAKSNSLWIVLIAGAILGFFISIAEPGLLVLAGQVGFVTSGQITSMSILVVVSIGLAIMLALGFLRITYNFPLYKMLMILYVLIFGLAIFTSREFLAISFDASGATTGILAVPFILSLSIGISKMKKDSKASEKDSFGLVAIASTGAILGVMLLDMFTKNTSFNADIETVVTNSDSIIKPFIVLIPDMLMESIIAMSPLVVILLVLQKAVFKLQKREFHKMVNGFIYAFIGLVIFLIGVNGGFMDVGTSIGRALALMENKVPIVIIGFIIGLVTILAEPAVHVLTQQIEEVTSGYVKRVAVLVPLSLGVGVAVALSVIRILVPEIQLLHYLVPGYIISLGLMFFVPKLFIGIAFDAGGVATGPMTATFILAFVQGAAHAFEGADMLVDGFGMIAMVAMAPIITLQLLGLVFQSKAKKKGAVKKHEIH
jgi:hypothetical protein